MPEHRSDSQSESATSVRCRCKEKSLLLTRRVRQDSQRGSSVAGPFDGFGVSATADAEDEDEIDWDKLT